MRIGIDFDNTIVSYDALFHRVALERGLIPPDVPVNKSEVRNHLRRIGREDDWTEMQGYVYGPRLGEAEPFPGVLDFFKACHAAGIEALIISHKTRHPYLGEKHDLHEAARQWLESRRFHVEPIGLPRERVFLELTKEAKLQRIGACGCNYFIDDLPEFLAEAAFPTSAQRILFDPANLYADEKRFAVAQSWPQLQQRLIHAGGN